MTANVTEQAPLLVSELVRGAISNCVGFLSALMAYVLLRPDSGLEWGALAWAYLGGYFFVASALTVWAYAGLRGEGLRSALVDGNGRGPEWGRRIMANPRARAWIIGGSALTWSWAITLTSLVLALGLVAFSTANYPGFALMVTGIPGVIFSWGYLLIVYAEHYAREDASRGGVQFPGAEEREFSDYIYLALAGHTTFGTTDVEITSPRMRRLMMGQSVAAFVFNTVILAVLISLLVG